MVGQTLPPERRCRRQFDTGARITRLTGAAAMHHHLYFTTSSWPAAGDCLYFVSYRTGYPNLFRYVEAGGSLVQVTDRVDINPFSAAIAPDGSALYFSARQTIWRVDAETYELTPLATIPGARLANCSLNPDGSLLAIGCHDSQSGSLRLVRTDGSGHDELVRHEQVGHVQFRPSDGEVLLFSGPPSQRMWLVDLDGSDVRPLYEQRADEWIVHESWLGDGDEVIFSHWPSALRAIQPASGAVRTIASFNAWHACGNRDGSLIVADSTRPDVGLRLICPRTRRHTLLCRTNATGQGTQWRSNRPAEGAGIDLSIVRGERPDEVPAPTPKTPEGVYGPQWTHPHPSFSPDGQRVVYTSDNGGGWSQVYVVELPQSLDHGGDDATEDDSTGEDAADEQDA